MDRLEVSFPKPCEARWDDMATVGCNRHCAQCDKTIHDLRNYSFDEVKALVETADEVCVRAQIGSDGSVALKRSRKRTTGRLVIAASAGMLALAPPAFADSGGRIVGQIQMDNTYVRVTATDAAGNIYRAVVRNDGRYWFRPLPPGNYVVSAENCSGEWTVGAVTVGNRKVVLPKSANPRDECIIIGVITLTGDDG
jgi:hypothetical protein